MKIDKLESENWKYLRDNLPFAKVLEKVHSLHRLKVKKDVKQKPYLKSHYDAVNSDLSSADDELKADAGIQLLAALNVTSDAPVFSATECDWSDLHTHTGLAWVRLLCEGRTVANKDRLADQDQPEKFPSYLAALVLKMGHSLEKVQRHYRAALTDKRRREFAEKLSWSNDMIDSVEIGWSDIESKWTLAERNGYGDVCNIVHIPDKHKLEPCFDAPDGLTLPRGWRERRGTLYIFDNLDMTVGSYVHGVRAIGRQPYRESLVDLAILLRSVPDDIVLLERNDCEIDDLEEANYLSEKLSHHLGRKIPVVLANTITSGQEVSKRTEGS